MIRIGAHHKLLLNLASEAHTLHQGRYTASMNRSVLQIIMQILGDERAASHLFVFDIKQFPDSVHQGFSGHCARRLLIQVKSVLTDSLIFQGRIIVLRPLSRL